MAAAVTVEAAFGTDPLTVPVGWTDISAYVRHIQILRGRQVETEEFEPGMAFLMLLDPDRRFDPLNTSSPYSPNVKPQTRLRVTVTDPDTLTDHVRFVGFVEAWPSSTASRGEADTVVNITCVDMTGILAGAGLPSSVYEHELSTDTMTWRLPLTWHAGEFHQDLSGNQNHGRVKGGRFNSRESIIVGIDDPILDWDGSAHLRLPTIDAAANAPPYSYEFWMQSTDDAVSILFAQKGPGGEDVAILSDGTDLQFFAWIDAVNPAFDVDGVIASGLMDGRPHHVVCIAKSLDPEVWIDGVEVTNVVVNNAFSSTGRGGAITVGSRSPGDFPFVGALQQFAFYKTELSQARRNAHLSAGRTPWQGDLAGERIDRILDIAGLAAGDRDIDTGNTVLQAERNLGRRKALEHLRLINLTEQGRLWVSKDGKVTFDDRNTIATAGKYTTVQGTFGDVHSGEALRYSEADLDYSTDIIRNRITATRSSGGTYTAEDATSQADFGEREESVSDLLHLAENGAEGWATARLAKLKDPLWRARAVEFRPVDDDEGSGLWAQLLGRDLGDLVTIKRTPLGQGTEINRDMLIEHITETIRPGGDHTVTWACSALDVDPGYWVWGTSTWGTSKRWG